MLHTPELQRVERFERGIFERRTRKKLHREKLLSGGKPEKCELYAGGQVANPFDTEALLGIRVTTAPKLEDFLVQYHAFVDGVNEIATNYITGLLVWGEFFDTLPEYSKKHRGAHEFVNWLFFLMHRDHLISATKKQVEKFFHPLAQEYFRSITDEYQGSEFEEFLAPHRERSLEKLEPFLRAEIDANKLSNFDVLLLEFMLGQFLRGKLELPKQQGFTRVGYFNLETDEIWLLPLDPLKTTGLYGVISAAISLLTNSNWLMGRSQLDMSGLFVATLALGLGVHANLKVLRERWFILRHELAHALSASVNLDSSDWYNAKGGLIRLKITPDKPSEFLLPG